MKNKKFYKELLILAIPIMIQCFITSCLNLMDSLMIGSLGDEAVAALGISNQYYLIFNLILLGIYSGGGVMISQYFGTKDFKAIKKILGICLAIGTVFTVIYASIGFAFSGNIIGLFDKNIEVINLGSSYLKVVVISYIFMTFSFAFGISSRCIGNAYMPMFTSAIALIFNIVLNYGFIFGKLGMPNLGVVGAAYATVIARFIEMVIMIGYIYLSNSPLKSNFSELYSFDRSFFDKTVKNISPVVVNELCWGLGVVIYSYIYGKLGTKAIAAVQISNTIQSLFMIILFAVSNAACVMIGKKIGEGDEKLAKNYGDNFIKLSIIIGIVMSLLLFVFSPQILSIYSVSEEVSHNALFMLYINAILLTIKFISIILIVGIFRGGGSANIALKIELITMWLVGVPVCFIGAIIFKLEVYQVFILVGLEEIAKCIISLVVYRKNTWIKNITVENKIAV